MRLFRRADPCMVEEKKFRFLMRGVKEALFAVLVCNPAKTVAEIVTEASTIGRALEMCSKKYDRNFVGATNANYVDSMRTPADCLFHPIAVIRKEVQQALGTSTTPEAPRE